MKAIELSVALELNRGVEAQYRPQLARYYYDPARYKTYLEQLGLKYPTVR